MRRVVISMLCVLFFTGHLYAQAGNASLSGFVQDPAKAFIPGVKITVVNSDTNQKFQVTTNRSGSYNIGNLPVGPYKMTVEKEGFSTIQKDGLFLHTQDVLQLSFTMAVGSTSDTVTVAADSDNLNMTDASVGTVIDQKFVESIPMNGRSFQTLVLLQPGVVTATPQGGDEGEYSVNGMRTDTNNFMVDGVSGSNSPGLASAAGSAGKLSSSTMLGTTQSLLSIDAMQEFRITTSTYSAEYGRQPGAQVNIQSRSGTNKYHGTAYDYLRNSFFDANNWFNDYATPRIPTPAERQNDFGGTIAGPLSVPYLFSAKDRAFLFFSYEGLRLKQPQPVSIIQVPSNGSFYTATYTNPKYANLRLYAPAPLQPLLNAFPLPNCTVAMDPQCVDYGGGGAPYLQNPSSAGTIDSISARVDFQVLPTMHLFARYGDTTSSAQNFQSPFSTATTGRNHIYLLGVDNVFRGSISNSFRAQYSAAVYHYSGAPSSVGGAQPIDMGAAQGLPTVGGETVARFYLPNQIAIAQESYGSLQFQPNIVDTFTWQYRKHLFKAGADARQTTAYFGDGKYSRGPFANYSFTTPDAILSNSSSTSTVNYQRQDPTSKDLGLFLQDEWRILPRLSLSLGLRWELNPPPSVSGAQMYTYTGDVTQPSTLGISKLGAPLYKTTYTDFSPRVGAAWTISNVPGHQLVLRAGGGLFYDVISMSQTFGAGYSLGASGIGKYYGTSGGWPLTSPEVLVAPTVPAVVPYSFQYYPNNNLEPSSAIHWNVSLEQALGGSQTFTINYVASLGRKLTTFREYAVGNLNPNFVYLYLYTNGPGSSYDSLQLRYQRRMAKGLQVLTSYTWAHAIDWASSQNFSTLPLQKGNSSHDLRNNFTGALVYEVASHNKNHLVRTVLGRWNTSLWFVARSAFPYTPSGPAVTDPVSGEVTYSRLNYNGRYPYVQKTGIPGGRQLDPTVFSISTAANGDGNLPRNFLRGFGELQENFSVQRSFPLYRQYILQFRAEAFNIANHATFGTVDTTCGPTTAGATCNNSLMGQPINTLSSGLGGLNSLYQQGGPRSLELVLKVRF